MGGQLATSETILVSAAGVIAADSAGLSAVKSYSALLTSIAAMPLAGGTFTGNVLFTDDTYTIGAAGATRPSAVHVGNGGVTSEGAVTAGGSLPSNFLANRTTGAGAAEWGLSIQYQGSTKAGIDANVGTGEVRVGGLATGGYYSVMYSNGSPSLSFTTAGVASFSATVSLGTYTVATLPSAGSNAYKMANVSDSNAAALGNYGVTVAGGGSNKVKVFSDGTNWVIA